MNASGGVTLEILDASGKLVRRYASSDKPWITPEELAKQAIPPYWVKPPQVLATTPGMHRWVWDLHYTAPTALESQYPISAVPHATPRHPLGPYAAPGNYTVRLIADGRTIEAPLTVTLDPRVNAPASGITQMFDAQMRLADMLNRSSEAVLKARAMLAQLGKGKEALRTELTTALSGPKEPEAGAAAQRPAKTTEATPQQKPATPAEPPPTLEGVQADLASLYEAIERADAPPTAAQINAINATTAKFDAIMKRWEKIASR
jgi:hypothetical protein